MDSKAPLAYWGEDYAIFDGGTGLRDITGFLPGEHTVSMTASDNANAVSVFSSQRIKILVKSYPELVYCDIVTRPAEPYSCSVVMTGNDGDTTVIIL